MSSTIEQHNEQVKALYAKAIKVIAEQDARLKRAQTCIKELQNGIDSIKTIGHVGKWPPDFIAEPLDLDIGPCPAPLADEQVKSMQ